MIGPSALPFAEKCGYASLLAEKHPETSAHSERGQMIHAEIARALATHDVATLPEAQSAVEWYMKQFSVADKVAIEESVVLVDDLIVITKGTPDLVIYNSECVTVVDWKTGRPENVPDPDDSLQLIAYGLAVCDSLPFRGVYAFLSDDEPAVAHWSRVFTPAEHPALLTCVRAAACRDRVPSPGDHCERCYQRWYCESWKARVNLALTVTAANANALSTLDAETATALATRIACAENWLDVAKATFREYIRGGGECIVDGKRARVTEVKGHSTADLAALKRDGLVQYIREGKPYERIVWRKDK